jgi:hypothetical protein
LIPLFASGLYPLLGRCVKVTPLRKMAAGHIFTVAALVTAGFGMLIHSRIYFCFAHLDSFNS